MPELPEVETVRRGLEPHLVGKKIVAIEVLHRRAQRVGSDINLAAATGARVKAVKRIGKFLWFVLDRDFALVGHLGMSGQLIFARPTEALSTHTRARIKLSSGRYELRFIDQRTFGWLAIDALVETDRGALPESCSHIAPDPFSPDFNRSAVIEDIRSRKSEIKRVLLNQEIVSGIGNIYADEALWRARIHPERLAARIPEREILELLTAAKFVMSRALKKGGTSFDDLYVNVNGESGYFEISLRAYGCEGEPCNRCGAAIRRIAFANRSSHFCPNCQRKSGKTGRPKGRDSRRGRG